MMATFQRLRYAETFRHLGPAGTQPRRERLSFAMDQPANWIRFARAPDGRVHALLHGAPDGALLRWESAPDGLRKN